MSNAKRLWDRRRTAAWLGIGLRTLDQHVKNDTIPSLKIGRRRMFDERELEQWIQRQQHKDGD